jgi:hypothetical protein
MDGKAQGEDGTRLQVDPRAPQADALPHAILIGLQFVLQHVFQKRALPLGGREKVMGFGHSMQPVHERVPGGRIAALG